MQPNPPYEKQHLESLLRLTHYALLNPANVSKGTCLEYLDEFVMVVESFLDVRNLHEDTL